MLLSGSTDMISPLSAVGSCVKTTVHLLQSWFPGAKRVVSVESVASVTVSGPL